MLAGLLTCVYCEFTRDISSIRTFISGADGAEVQWPSIIESDESNDSVRIDCTELPFQRSEELPIQCLMTITISFGISHTHSYTIKGIILMGVHKDVLSQSPMLL